MTIFHSERQLNGSEIEYGLLAGRLCIDNVFMHIRVLEKYVYIYIYIMREGDSERQRQRDRELKRYSIQTLMQYNAITEMYGLLEGFRAL